MRERRVVNEHCTRCGRHVSSCTCGQPYQAGHLTPEFYRSHGYCDGPCRECNRLDEEEFR